MAASVKSSWKKAFKSVFMLYVMEHHIGTPVILEDFV